MLRLIEVDHIGEELLTVGIVFVWKVRINFLDLLFAFFSWWGSFASLLCGFSSSFLLFLSLLLFFLFLEAFLLFFINFLLFLALFRLWRHHLSELLCALQIRSKPVLDSDLYLSVFEATDKFLVAKHISICESIFNVRQKWVVLGQLYKPVCKHGLVEKILRPLDVVPVLVFDKA